MHKIRCVAVNTLTQMARGITSSCVAATVMPSTQYVTGKVTFEDVALDRIFGITIFYVTWHIFSRLMYSWLKFFFIVAVWQKVTGAHLWNI